MVPFSSTLKIKNKELKVSTKHKNKDINVQWFYLFSHYDARSIWVFDKIPSIDQYFVAVVEGFVTDTSARDARDSWRLCQVKGTVTSSITFATRAVSCKLWKLNWGLSMLYVIIDKKIIYGKHSSFYTDTILCTRITWNKTNESVISMFILQLKTEFSLIIIYIFALYS